MTQTTTETAKTEAKAAPSPKAPKLGQVILYRSLNKLRSFNGQADYPAMVTQLTDDGPIVTCFPPHRAPFPLGQPLRHVSSFEGDINAVEAWDWLPKS